MRSFAQGLCLSTFVTVTLTQTPVCQFTVSPGLAFTRHLLALYPPLLFFVSEIFPIHSPFHLAPTNMRGKSLSHKNFSLPPFHDMPSPLTP
jgi:hypothetical protein